MTAGLFLVDKPEGLSSAKVVAHIKRSLPEVRKIGHAGTLDPFATGLLVCLVNSATRLASVAEFGEKVYTGTFRLGMVSDTHDKCGVIEKVETEIPSFEHILKSAQQFHGEIEQTPPNISAVKVNGARAYKLARKGVEFELKSRMTTVSELKLEELESGLLRYRIRCSKGTYIRSIARDLGEELGCGALVESLRREESFPFQIADATLLDQIGFSDMKDWRVLFPEAGMLELSEFEAQKLQNGDQRLYISLYNRAAEKFGSSKKEVICVHESNNSAMSLLQYENGQWKFAMNVLSEKMQEANACRL